MRKPEKNQSRVSAANADAVLSQAAAANVPAEAIGKVGGAEIVIGGTAAVPLQALRRAHEGWFPRFMDAKPPA